MSSRYWGWGFPKYVSVAEKKARVAQKLKKLMKSNPDLCPVVVEGRTIARTWWGKAWTRNLERYADYSNRIGRGRSYVCHGAVLDLRIDFGEVRALVQGSAASPYKVVVRTAKLGKEVWRGIKTACEGKLESLQGLLEGSFPKELGEIFTAEGTGLFPAPKEVTFSCTCPDWAEMCKHVASGLYGVGARLDQDPHLFFKLRSVDVGELVHEAVSHRSGTLLEKAHTSRKSARVLKDSDLSSVFGIELDVLPAPGQSAPRPHRSMKNAAYGKGTNKLKIKPETASKQPEKGSLRTKKQPAVTRKGIDQQKGERAARGVPTKSEGIRGSTRINHERERRIEMEAIVDCYNEMERSMGWYYYLEGRLHFPFDAQFFNGQPNSRLQPHDRVRVLRMAPEEECERDISVTVRRGKRNLSVPLAQLKPVSANSQTIEAIEDWHYWVRRGYQF